MIAKNSKSGFTVVELLVTLFIAAAFLATGYQLYGAIIKDAGNTRAQARANSVAKDYLNRYESSATSPCTTLDPLTDSSVSISGISASTISISISCPYAGAPNVSKVTATLKYNNPQKTASISSYKNTDTLGLEDGLVGWWPLNGNANDNSVNGKNGTVVGASPTTGQGGASNTAYSFNGTSSYISLPGTWGGSDMNEMTVSAWYYVVADTGTFATLVEPTDAAFIHMHLYPSSTGRVYTDTGYSAPANIPQTPVGAWHNLVVSSKSGNTAAYLDGVLQGAVDTSTYSYIQSTSTLQIGRGYSGARYFNGKIDDVRIYNRALTTTDIQALYGLGAY